MFTTSEEINLSISQALKQAILYHRSGQFQNAEKIYRAILEKEPNHPDANHNLGVLAVSVDKIDLAIPFFQKAIEINPNIKQYHKSLNDALNKAEQSQKEPSLNEIQTLVNLFNKAKYLESLSLAEKMTKYFPKYGFGWKVLGTIYKTLGRKQESLKAMEKALALAPNDSESYYNLGIVLHDLGRFIEAKTSFLKAIEIKHDYTEAYYNVGIVSQDLGRFTEAEIYYLKAIELKSDYVEAYMNLGNVFKELGRLTESKIYYLKAIKLKPDNSDAFINLGYLLQYLDYTDEAITAYKECIKLSPLSIGLHASIRLAILYYLRGNLKDSYTSLVMSKKIIDMSADKEYRNSASYWIYLDSLHSWYKNNKQKNNQTKKIRKIYIVGDSHSLAAHGLIVKYNNIDMLCTTEWILGCKQWHLGNAAQNVYKHKFEAIMARLPIQSTVLLTIGEIDCRHDEGILKVWKKSKDERLEDIALSTIKSYLLYVVKVTGKYNHKIVINGVPAANNIKYENLSVQTADQVVNMIKIFNMILKREALSAGMDFLDVYALTNRGDGIAISHFYIDSHHLIPAAISEAFNKFLTYKKKQEPVTIDFSKPLQFNLSKPSI